MLIHVLTQGFKSPNGAGFLYPILFHKRKLADLNLEIKLFYQASRTLRCCDIIIIDSKYYSKRWTEDKANETIEEIELMKEDGAKIIYADISDSAGVVHLKMLSAVHLYIKNQIYKDKALYMKPLYGYRLFSDYVHHHHDIRDAHEAYSEAPKDKKQLDKIHVGWNSGLSNHGMLGYYLQFFIEKLNPYFPLVYPNKKKYNYDTRKNDLQARFNTNYNRNSVAYLRKIIEKHISSKYHVGETKKLKRFSYFRELCTTKIILSPFGLGEITLKDFEVFITGGVLVKPDMSHMQTWPNFYIENETVIFHQWDLLDFDDKLDDLLCNPLKAKSIAQNGQENYFQFINDTFAGEKFSNHFKSILDRALV